MGSDVVLKLGGCMIHIRFFQKLTGRSFSPKLKTQLTASFMAMSFIILLISTIFAYTSMVEIIQNQSYKTNLKQIQQLEYNIDSFKRDVDKISRLLIISMDVQNYLGKEITDDPESIELANNIFKSLSQMLSNYEHIESIYYYGENGMIIGVTSRANQYLLDSSKKNFFYNSDIYKKVKENNLGIHWFGGYTSLDFDISLEGSEAVGVKGTHYITAARGVNYLGSQTATVVININEKLFTSIYANASIDNESSRYIIDDNGKIISHVNESKINQKSILQNYINDEELPFGSIISEQTNRQVQVIYYKLKDVSWTMVDEIPLSVLFSDINKLRRALIFMFIICTVAAFGISIYWIYRITKPLNELTGAMREMENGRLGHMLAKTSRNELGLLGRQFNNMSQSILELINQVKKIEKEKRKLEIESLQAQINPHFLYNTLNTIKYMAAIIKADNIADSITTLGNILKPIYKNTGIICAISEEIDYVRNYIRIMNYRFGEGIRVVIDIQEELLNCNILRFILQPIIENSLSYGMDSKNRKIDIAISGVDLDEDIRITIEDNGIGMDEKKLKEVRESLTCLEVGGKPNSSGIGLVNVNSRLRLHFGDNYGIDIFSEKNRGTKVILKFPKVQKS